MNAERNRKTFCAETQKDPQSEQLDDLLFGETQLPEHLNHHYRVD